MERVLFDLHSQASLFALRNTSSKTRSFLEHGILLVALAGFSVLILSHLSFVHHGESVMMARAPNELYWDSDGGGGSSQTTAMPQKLDSQQNFRISKSLSLLRKKPTSCLQQRLLLVEEEVEQTSTPDTATKTPILLPEASDVTRIHISNQDTQTSTHLLSYSRTKGYLFLTEDQTQQHKITTQHVSISNHDPICFGEPFLQAIAQYVTGHDTVVINWLLAYFGHQGYVLQGGGSSSDSPTSKEHINNNNVVLDLSEHVVPNYYDNESSLETVITFKLVVLLTSLFLFFVTTTLISFTLRETQDRMLQFTLQLQALVRARETVGRLVVTHVIESLVFVPVMVGMMFFLIEFYRGDKFLAFMVLSLVWVCEVFSVISLRTVQGMQYFPAVFFFLFLLFHIYFFSFPFGFSYTALTSTACFMFHSMLFFWNRYELPAVAHQLVTAENPRQVGALGFVQDPRFVPSLADTRLHQFRMMTPPSNPSTGITNTTPTTPPNTASNITGDGTLAQPQPVGTLLNSYESNAFEAATTTTTSRSGTTVVASSSGTLRNAPSDVSTSRPFGRQEHQQPSQQSFISNASVSRSTQPLFQESGAVAPGGSIVGDDESDSYMVFMDGEIVTHRQRHQQQQHTSRSSSPVTPASLDRSVTLRPQAQQHLQQPNTYQIPENISMEVTQQPDTLNTNLRIKSSGSHPCGNEDQVGSATPGFTIIQSSLSRNSGQNTSGLTLEEMSQEIQSGAASGGNDSATGSTSECVPPPPTELIFGNPHTSGPSTRAKAATSNAGRANSSVASSTNTTGTNYNEEGRYDQTPRVSNTHHPNDEERKEFTAKQDEEEEHNPNKGSMPIFPFFGFGQSPRLQPRGKNNTESSS